MRRSFLRQCDFVPARPFGTLGDSQPALQGLPAPGPARPARARTRSGDSESWCSEWAVPSSKCWYHAESLYLYCLDSTFLSNSSPVRPQAAAWPATVPPVARWRLRDWHWPLRILNIIPHFNKFNPIPTWAGSESPGWTSGQNPTGTRPGLARQGPDSDTGPTRMLAQLPGPYPAGLSGGPRTVTPSRPALNSESACPNSESACPKSRHGPA